MVSMAMLMVVVEMVNGIDGDDILMVAKKVVVKMMLLMEMTMFFPDLLRYN